MLLHLLFSLCDCLRQGIRRRVSRTPIDALPIHTQSLDKPARLFFLFSLLFRSTASVTYHDHHCHQHHISQDLSTVQLTHHIFLDLLAPYCSPISFSNQYSLDIISYSSSQHYRDQIETPQLCQLIPSQLVSTRLVWWFEKFVFRTLSRSSQAVLQSFVSLIA